MHDPRRHALQAQPRLRPFLVAPGGLQTLWWRAPEVHFGSQGFDQAIDIFSLGLVLAELGAGSRFQAEVVSDQAGGAGSDIAYSLALFKQLGTPQGEDFAAFATLPSWPRVPHCFPGVPWSARLATRLGVAGVALLNAMLAWQATLRPQAADILKHAFVEPRSFGLHCATPCFQGSRHPWNIVVGSMAPEVLEWVRGDPALQPGSPEFVALGVDFLARRKNAKSEEGRKFILAGAFGQCGSSALCGLSLAEEMPVPRLVAWRRALLQCNATAFAALDASARDAVLRLPEENRGKNGQQFLDLGFGQWFASCGELVFADPGSEERGLWAEPRHQDGGASVLHLGVTLYGRRVLTCSQGFDLPDVRILNAPGTVYLGSLTGPTHQVTHQEAAEVDMLDVPGLGRCSVTLMARTSLFAYDRARLRGSTPSPYPFFAALARSFREAIAQQPLVLPSLAECQAFAP